MDAPEPQQWFTIAEAAAYTRFSVEYIKRRLQRGDLRCTRPVGSTRGNRRIHRADLDAFMRSTAYQPLIVQKQPARHRGRLLRTPPRPVGKMPRFRLVA